MNEAIKAINEFNKLQLKINMDFEKRLKKLEGG